MARALLCAPWEVQVEVEVIDGELVKVLITRMPPMKPERRVKALGHAEKY